MTNYRRSFIAGASYFFTVNLAGRSSRLLIEHIDWLREAIRYTRARHPFEIDAVVVLPDHLPAIWTLPQGDSDYALRWRLIKTVFSRQLAPGERKNSDQTRFIFTFCYRWLSFGKLAVERLAERVCR